MRLARLVSIVPFVLVACGDDSGGDPVFLDAAVPDAEPDAAPPPDAPPCPDDECDGVCVNFEEDELTCGNCTTTCGGGEWCNAGTCECPPGFVPGAPAFLFDTIQVQGPATIGIGIFSNSGSHGLIVPYATTGTATGVDYPLTEETFGTTLPAILAGYNVDIQNMTFDAAYGAIAGTVTFDTICDVGFTGHAAGLTFKGLSGGINNPMIDPDGCEFMVETLTFAYGDPCPAAQ